MDGQTGLLLDCSNNYLYLEKSIEEAFELSMEQLADPRARAVDELKTRDEEIAQLKEMLSRAIKERDEAQERCQRAVSEKIFLQRQLQQRQLSAPHSGNSSIEDDPRRGMDSNNGFSTSDCDESIVSSPQHVPPQPSPEFPVALNGPLPEKGKLLQAVMKAGPLLHTLLLAGPLPQWRHPPPPLNADQIPPPPLAIPPPPPPPPLSTLSIHQECSSHDCGRINRKRGLSEGGFHSSTEFKYQRVVPQ